MGMLGGPKNGLGGRHPSERNITPTMKLNVAKESEPIDHLYAEDDPAMTKTEFR
jgi:hypothetical protein